MSDELTAEEMVELQKYLGAGAPTPEERHTVHTFLHKVATAPDTTKVGNLKEEEIGIPKNPVRTYKTMALISDKIMNLPYFRDFFLAESEIVTSTSLSRDAKLLNLAVITRRQLEDVTKPKKENKGWFKKKGGGGESEQV